MVWSRYRCLGKSFKKSHWQFEGMSNIKFIVIVKIDIANKNSFILPVNRNNYPNKNKSTKKIKMTTSRDKHFH